MYIQDPPDNSKYNLKNNNNNSIKIGSNRLDYTLWGYIWEGCCPSPITLSQRDLLYSEKFNIGGPENYIVHFSLFTVRPLKESWPQG